MKLRTTILTAIAALLLTSCGGAESSPEAASSAAETAPSLTTVSAAESIAEVPSGYSGPDESQAATSELTGLRDALLEASDLLNGSAVYGEKLFKNNSRKLYNCDESDLTDGMIVYNSGGGRADEVSVIKRTDGSADNALSVLESRKTLRYNDFKGYVPEELPKIEAGRVFQVGDWCVLIISNSIDSLEEIVKDKLK